MQITAALVRLPSPDLADGERTHYDRLLIDFARALDQHTAYRVALEAMGIAVTVLPALTGFPDAVFVEDALLAFPDLFVLTRPGAASRASEPDAIAPYVPADRPLVRMEAGRLDGGDVLFAGRRVLVGLSSRTDAAGVAELQRLLQPHGYAVETVTMPRALHLKSAMTALGDDTLVVARGWVPDPPPGFHIIDADPDEPSGANMLWANGRALGQAGSPRTIARVAAAVFDVTPVDNGEFAKAESGLTCMSVLIPG